MKKIRKALVTGGAGFIGSHLVDALLAVGVQVTVLDNLATGHRANLADVRSRITFIEGDICQRPDVEAAAADCDVIFHQAAVVSVPQTVADPLGSASVNELGTLTVLDVARIQGDTRVVLASSCAVYGDDPEQPKHEALRLCPQSPYALQKLTGERYARLYFELYGLETVCLRYFNVYGPRQDPSSPYSGVISIFMDHAVQQKAPMIYGDGGQSRDFVFVKDVVRANLLAASARVASGQAVNIGTGHSETINQLWEIVGRLSGFDMSPRYVASRAGDIRLSMADISRAENDLDFKPKHHFEDGIAATFKWYEQREKRA